MLVIKVLTFRDSDSFYLWRSNEDSSSPQTNISHHKDQEDAELKPLDNDSTNSSHHKDKEDAELKPLDNDSTNSSHHKDKEDAERKPLDYDSTSTGLWIFPSNIVNSFVGPNSTAYLAVEDLAIVPGVILKNIRDIGVKMTNASRSLMSFAISAVEFKKEILSNAVQGVHSFFGGTNSKTSPHNEYSTFDFMRSQELFSHLDSEYSDENKSFTEELLRDIHDFINTENCLERIMCRLEIDQMFSGNTLGRLMIFVANYLPGETSRIYNAIDSITSLRQTPLSCRLFVCKTADQPIFEFGIRYFSHFFHNLEKNGCLQSLACHLGVGDLLPKSYAFWAAALYASQYSTNVTAPVFKAAFSLVSRTDHESCDEIVCDPEMRNAYVVR
ncbi:hypothetical protein SK128_004828 [Halocaridina rubra]|uniref:Uncharacterized protein n=1 Tax=Halocaridina rubra TaxID=373956 RepID=A0AAN8WRL5_HALRR